MALLFTEPQIEAIARIFGHTEEGLTGSQIYNLLNASKIPDIEPNVTKWKRLRTAFFNIQKNSNKRNNILAFIRIAMKPENFIENHDKHKALRLKLNKALSFCGINIKETGELVGCNKAYTLSEAEERANDLKSTLNKRDIHPDVIKFCSAEFLQNNYFHCVLEAVKSIFDKLRNLANLNSEGEELSNKCLNGKNPKIKINSFKTESEKMEQKGFNKLINGIYSMFRNPTAHEAKINWEITQRDAEDLLTMVSMIHRRLDASKVGSF